MSLSSPPPRSAREAFGLQLGGLMGSSNPQSRGPRGRLPIKLIVGIVSAFLLVTSVPHLAPAVRAGLHDGTRGTWVATTKTCHKSACMWTGNFVTPGGHVAVASTHYAGPIPAGTRAGYSIPALFTGGSGVVFPITGSDLWIELVIALLASVIGLYWATHAWVAERLTRSGQPGVLPPGDRG